MGAWEELRALNDRLERELAASVAREAKLREALERIALGIYGRVQTGLRDGEGGCFGLPNQPQPDWQLALDALASSKASGDKACPRCHGEGVVTFNKSRDPQHAEDGLCDVCHGTGDAPAEPATEEKP